MKTTFIELNSVTYNAILSLISSKDGVDISPILKDLGGANPSAALNAGLLMMGKELKLPFSKGYDILSEKCYYEIVAESVSFILDKVEVTKQKYKKEEDGTINKVGVPYEKEMPIADFLALKETISE